MTGPRDYRVLLYLLVFCGILAFSVANETLFLAGISLPVLLLAWTISGSAAGHPLPRWLINALLLAATGYLVLNLRGAATEYISELATYLTTLQLIKLFDVRQPRDQGQIISLSVMLMIGACLTSVTAELAAVLALYVPLLLMTVIRHHLHSGHEAARQRQEESAPRGVRPQPIVPAVGRRHRRSLRRVTALSGLSVGAVAILIFLIMPRGVGDSILGQWKPAAQGATIAFNDHVRLGSVSGMLSESQRIVMHVRVDPVGEDDFLELGTPWYLRGAILNEYRPDNSLWRRSDAVERLDRDHTVRRGDQPGRPSPESAGIGATGVETFDVRVTMRDRQVDQLFTTWVPEGLALHDMDSRQVEYSRNTYDHTWLLKTPKGPIEYSFRAFRRARADLGRSDEDVLERTRIEPPSMQWFRDNERIHGLAADILRSKGIDPDNLGGDLSSVPRLFESHLRQNYDYTTELVAPLAGEDPIEMFLFSEERGGRGNCEYFAAAHVALCQSVGINARLIAGYVTSDYDRSRGYYIVRESNAHAWVEAELRPGLWREFDPSPPDGVAAVQRPRSGLRDLWRRTWDAVELAWVENVVRYDSDSQAATFGARQDSPSGLYAGLQSLAEHFGLSADESSVRHFIRAIFRALGAGAIAFGALALCLFIARTPLDVLRERLGSLVGLSWLRSTPDTRVEIAGFYGDLLRMLEEAGLAKPSWQPPLAWAAALTREHAAIGPRVAAVADLYYHERFAGAAPAPHTEQQARDILQALQADLALLNPPAPEDDAPPEPAADAGSSR